MIKGAFAQVSHPHPAIHLAVRPLNPSTKPTLFPFVHLPTVLAGNDGKEASNSAYSDKPPTGYKM